MKKLIYVITLCASGFLFSCSDKAKDVRSLNVEQEEVTVKTIKEYVVDNDFINIVPEVYYGNLSRSSLSAAKQQDLENQMVAATYRFYKKCTQDEKGRITCHISSGKEINISEELFQRKLKDVKETNEFVEKHLKNGTKYRVGVLNEKYFNELLNYKAR